MPVDYGEVLKELDAQIAALESEIETLRDGRSTIVILRNKYSRPVADAHSVAPSYKLGHYAGMGPTAAIRILLAGQQYALTTGEIVDKLKAGGLTTKGSDLSGNVSSTLSRMKEQRIVEKVNDGWKLKPVQASVDVDQLLSVAEQIRQKRDSSEPETLSLQ